MMVGGGGGLEGAISLSISLERLSLYNVVVLSSWLKYDVILMIVTSL